MSKADAANIVRLSNDQIDYKEKGSFLWMFICFVSILFLLTIAACAITLLSYNKNPETHILIGLLYALCVLSGLGSFVVLIILFSKKIDTGFDKHGKTREDKLKEFWEKVLSSQNEIKIEKVNVQTEDYMQTQVLKENTGVSKSVKMIWRDMVLFERNNEGNVSHLEGMPSILMLRE